MANCVLSLGGGHSVLPWNLSPQTREKECVWCVFDSSFSLDQTLCLQPMAGHSLESIPRRYHIPKAQSKASTIKFAFFRTSVALSPGLYNADPIPNPSTPACCQAAKLLGAAPPTASNSVD